MSATKVVMAPRPPKDQELLEKEEDKTTNNVQQLTTLLVKLERLVDTDPEQCKIEFFNVEYMFYQLPPKLRTQALANRVETLQKKMDHVDKHVTVAKLDQRQIEDKAFLDMNEEHLFADLKMDEDKAEPIMSKSKGADPKKSEDQEDMELLQKLERDEANDEHKTEPMQQAVEIDKTMSELIIEPMPKSKETSSFFDKSMHSKKKEKEMPQKHKKEIAQHKSIEIKPVVVKPKSVETPIEEDLENVDIPFEPLPQMPKNDLIQQFIDEPDLSKQTQQEPIKAASNVVQVLAKIEPARMTSLPQQVVKEMPRQMANVKTPESVVPTTQNMPVKNEESKKQVLQSDKLNFIKPEQVTSGMSSMELYERGLHLFHQRNYEQALGCFKEVLKLAPNNLAARIRLQEVQEEMNKM